MTCYFTRKRLGAYLDGALDPRATRSTTGHLAGCARCQAEIDSLRSLRSLLQRTLATAEPDWTGFWPGIVRGVQDRRMAPARRATAWRPRWALGGALAAALLVSLGVWQLTPETHLTPDGVLISSATTGDPHATVVAYSTPEQDVAVVWVLGLSD
ncbi:MAG TPA: zf-HC2 domain-containing protein [Methylomirabilota bacterium]|nr:zf-HC2 domain-containing protein [Methylomirabilota bacterium]